MEHEMSAIAARIRQRRKELGYSYQDLANLTGMNKSSLQRYESGSIGNIPLHRLETLAKALQVSPAWLMGWGDALDTLERSGYGLDTVAQELNIPADTIRKIMDGSDSESQKTIVQVAQLLVRELCTGALIISDTDPQLDAILNSAKQLNAQGLERLGAYADDLVASGKYRKVSSER